MRPWILVLVLSVGVMAASGADVKVESEVKARVGRLLKVNATSNDLKAVIRWINTHDDLDMIESETGRYATILPVKPGRYKIALYSDAGGPPSYCVIIAEGEAPKPPKPVDPDPVDPKPKPAGGMRVLIVYESAELAKMPEDQQGILYGKAVRDALNAACEQDGKVKGWRIWDKDVDASADTKGWAELLARPRASVPWVTITRGGVVTVDQALPADADAFLALLRASSRAKMSKGVR